MYEKEIQEIKNKLREKRKPDIYIYNNGKTKILTVIYENKEEIYQLMQINKYSDLSKESGNTYTRNTAIELCKNSGARRLNYKD